MLTPPESFGCVEEGVYRCSSLDPINSQFITTLGLVSLVSINPEKPPKMLRNFAQELDIELIHLGLRPWRASSDNYMLLSKELIQDGLKYVLDKRSHPMLILDSTNTFVGALRRMQHWSYSSVVGEFRHFSGGKSHYMAEIFLEMVQVRCIEYDQDKDQPASPSSQSHPQPPTEEDGNKKQRSKVVVVLPSRDKLPDWFIRQYKLLKQ